MRLLFSLTALLGAFLLFLVEPMFARMVLPLLGGAPAVWNTCLVFYQMALLAGYVYAHGVGRRPARQQVVLQIVLLIAAAVVMPIVVRGGMPPASANPIWWVFWILFLSLGLPFVVLFLPVVWWMLWRIGRGDGLAGEIGSEIVHGELAKLGPVRRPERIVLGVFLAAAGLWIAGKWLTAVLAPRVTLFELTSAHFEGGVAMLAAFTLLLWRTQGRQVLGFRALSRVPWETLLLLGGGFAMAAAIQKSGLSAYMSAQLAAVRGLPPFGQVLLASIATVALSAVASNTATIAVMLVVLKDAVAPEVMTTTLFAATIACSCDFALPAGTPPNAIVFGSGYVTIPRMARTGVVLDLLAAILAAVWCWVIVRWVV